MIRLGLGLNKVCKGSVSQQDTAPVITSQPPNLRVFQRATDTGGFNNKGEGAAAFGINLSATKDLWVRARSAIDGVTIVQPPWKAITGAPEGDSVRNITGIAARYGFFYLDFATTQDGSWALGTNKIGMGRVIAVSGQSLAVRMFGKMDGQTTTIEGAGGAVDANTSVYATYTDGQRTVSSAAWAVPANGSNYDSSFAAEFLRLQAAASGVSCGLVGHTRGGMSITAFIPSGSENAALRAVLDAVGGFEEFLWMQGHSDSGAGMNGATYKGHLDTLFTDVTSRNAIIGSGYDRVLASIPNINSSSWGTNTQVNTIRKAAKEWAATNSCDYIQPEDLDLIDGVHQSQYGSVNLAYHYYRATRLHLGMTEGDVGASMISATRAAGSADVIITMNYPSGVSALTAAGSPQLRFDVFNSGDLTTPLAFAASSPLAIDNGLQQITLKLASAPLNTQALDVWAFLARDNANDGRVDIIYDNNTDGDGVPVGRHIEANFAPIVVAAPGGGGTQVGPNLTVTSGTFAAGASGFGQEMKGGLAESASNTDVATSNNVWTIEGWVSKAAANSIRVAFGQGQKHWIGCNASGNAMFGFYNSSGSDVIVNTATSIVGGSRKHVALVSNGTNTKFYVDGVLVSTQAAALNNSSSAGTTFCIRNGGFNPVNSGFAWDGAVDEVAVWSIEKYTANFTPPSVPYVGNEAGMRALYHLDGDGNAAVY